MNAQHPSSRAALIVALAFLLAAAPVGAQQPPPVGPNDNLGNVFGDGQDEFGDFGAPPPPVDPNNPYGGQGFPNQPGANGAPGSPGGFNPPQGTYSPAPDSGSSNGAGFPSGGSSSGGSNPLFRTGGKNRAGSAGTSPSRNGTSPTGKKTSGKTDKSFATADPEDITNENFPDLIDSFDYPNAEITDIVKAISQLTKKNFIIDSGVRGKISIVAPTQITVAEAYKAFLSALAANGFTVVPSGKFLKIKQARDAQRDSIETYSGAYYPNADLMITRILHLKHISAEEVNKQLLRILPSKNGEMTPYPPTNSLIISDYGANIERITRILDQLDRPGFDEQLQVVPVRYAKARDVADLVTKIINKDSGGQQAPGGFGAVRPFRPGGGGKAEELSIVAPDERTNALIVVGNRAGIEKVRTLVKKLDYKLDPSEAGGVNVYYVKFGEAEKIAQTLNGLAAGTSTTGAAAGGAAAGGFGNPLGGGFGQPSRSPSPIDRINIFGGDVKIVADKNTNSLVITASKQDYETVAGLLSKLDIPRDQVFIEAVIMELNTTRNRVWDPAVYRFQDDGSGSGTGSVAGRVGFSGPGTLAKILNPSGDSGAILGFGSGGPLRLTLPGAQGAAGTVTIPSLVAFLNFLQTNTDTNILATPQLLATDNEEAEVEVGTDAPIGQTTATNGVNQVVSQQREKLTTKLTVTPFVRPESDAVRMKIKLPIKQLSSAQVNATNLAQNAIVVTDRNIKTEIVVRNGDTAVLGGLMRDDEEIAETKVPILGDIPVLGWLFKSSSNKKTKFNLLVFITPRIIRTMADSQENFVRKAKARIDWIKLNNGGRDPYGKYMDELPRGNLPDSASGTAKSDENVEQPAKKQ